MLVFPMVLARFSGEAPARPGWSPPNTIGERPFPTLFGGRQKSASKYNGEPTNHDLGQHPEIEHTVVERRKRRPKQGKYINFGGAQLEIPLRKGPATKVQIWGPHFPMKILTLLQYLCSRCGAAPLLGVVSVRGGSTIIIIK